MLRCVGRCFGTRGGSALLICFVIAFSALHDSCLGSSPNASSSWCRASMSLCLVPALTGCRTMPFVLISSLNLWPSLRLNLACRTTTKCSTKTTNRCLRYWVPSNTIMVRGDTGPCPPLSIDLTSALIILLVMSSVCNLIGLRPLPSSFAFVVVAPLPPSLP